MLDVPSTRKRLSPLIQRYWKQRMKERHRLACSRASRRPLVLHFAFSRCQPRAPAGPGSLAGSKSLPDNGRRLGAELPSLTTLTTHTTLCALLGCTGARWIQ